ncbi:MAG TPA: DUF5657 family protein [Candidatus Saccharimonadales bacterium]|nr:DUF5657 family protein [Candidatus Saccharimonadales bacterium]
MPFDITSFQTSQLIPFLKAGFLLIVGMYIIFSLIVVRQVFSMDSIVKEVHVAIVLKILAILLTLLGIWLFLSSLAIL